MSIHTTIKEQMKEAMINKDILRLTVLRGLISSFMNEIISKGIKTDLLDDESSLALIKRAVKQRKDSIDQFTKGGRNDLAETEKNELAILEKFLPQTLSHEEIIARALKIKEKLNISDKSKIGQFIGAIMKDTAGQADGSIVKSVAEELLQ